MNFLIIGYGGIGKKRASALSKLKYEQNYPIDKIYIYDPKYKQQENEYLIAAEDSFSDKAPDWVFISTPHNVSCDWINVVSNWGSKILIEKPMGRNLSEAQQILKSLKNQSQLYVGFNYRFYKGVELLAKDIFDNKFGQIISINLKLAHGGSPQDKYSWKLNPVDGSPDCLLDPAIHFLDLLNYIFPKRTIPLYGKSSGNFWETGIKEEIHMLMDMNGAVVNLQSSLDRWRNTFEIEVNGNDGYGIVSGRGKNYGVQTYTTGERWGWYNSSKSQLETEKTIVIGDCEDSFYLETKSLLDGGIENCNSIQALDDMILYDECMETLK